MKLTLDHVHIHLVGALGENQHIDMPQNQVVALIGENRDDGGSNGSSKSTFTYAAPVNLYGAKAVGKTNKELKNNRIKGTPRIINKYTIDGKPLIVDRTIGGELKYTYDGTEVSGSTDEVQAKLNKIIGMSMDQFLQFSYKGQKTTEHFLTMSDADKKEFLSSFFDVTDLEKMKVESDVKLAKFKKERDANKGALDQLHLNVAELTEKYNKAMTEAAPLLGNKEKNLDTNQKLYKTANEQLETLKTISDDVILQADQLYQNKLTAHNKLKEAKEAEISYFNIDLTKKKEHLLTFQETKVDEVATDLSNKIKALQEERSKVQVPADLTDQANTCVELINEQKNGIKLINPKQLELSAALQQIEINQGIIRDIDSKPCPTCQRAFDDSHKEKQKEQFLKKIKDFGGVADQKRNELNLLNEQYSQETLELLMANQSQLNAEIATYKTKAYSQIDASIADLNGQLNTHKMQRKLELETAMNIVKSDISELENKIWKLNTEVTQSNNDLSIQKMQALNAHKQAMSQVTQTINDLNVKILTLTGEINKIKNDTEKLSADLDAAQVKVAMAVDKQKKLDNDVTVQEHCCFILSKNGFTGYLFDTILDDLNAEINTNLKLVPVSSKFVLNFTPDKTAKTTGEVSKSITYELTKGGVESGLNMTSGAEELIILLAVDEAVETVLSRRLGINIGWKFLDEQLFWVDGNSKEHVFEFYKQKSKDKAYYIIDHASEFNAAIDCTIKVVKENDISRILHD